MEIVRTPESAVLAFFFLQGLVFAFLLLRAGWRHDHRPSYWLAGFMVLCSLYLVPFLGGYSGWYARDGYREVLFFFPFQQLFLIGPLIYCYVKSQLEPRWRLSRRELWHFLPGVLYLGYILLAFVVDVLVLDEYYFYANNRDKDLVSWYQISGLFMMVGYSAVSFRHYRQYRQRIFAELSFAEAVAYRWVGHFLLALLFIMVLRI
ncbi:MAG: AraC family transcriptional regulator, partial [Bacteroidota bacterium]